VPVLKKRRRKTCPVEARNQRRRKRKKRKKRKKKSGRALSVEPCSTEPYRRGNNALFLTALFLILKPLKEVIDNWRSVRPVEKKLKRR